MIKTTEQLVEKLDKDFRNMWICDGVLEDIAAAKAAGKSFDEIYDDMMMFDTLLDEE